MALYTMKLGSESTVSCKIVLSDNIMSFGLDTPCDFPTSLAQLVGKGCFEKRLLVLGVEVDRLIIRRCTGEKIQFRSRASFFQQEYARFANLY